ncbi:MAG: hypothetical protein ABGX37_01035 [Methylococcales bacterium]
MKTVVSVQWLVDLMPLSRFLDERMTRRHTLFLHGCHHALAHSVMIAD